MSQFISEKTMMELCKYGIQNNDPQNIECNRCFRKNLQACIEYKTHDLCLNCVYEIIKRKNKQIEEPKTKMEVKQFNNIIFNKR
jgi:hypothetical protein